MKSHITPGPAALMVMALLIACAGSGDEVKNNNMVPAAILGKVEVADIVKVSEAETYVGQSLYEYIDGGAEVYHQYGFVRVSTADFKAGELEIVADIYEFGDSDNAFGMYSTIRPPQVQAVDIGVQGFSSETSFDFVKGKFMIRLICYEGTAEARETLSKFAVGLAEIVPGTTSKPAMFDFFPVGGLVMNSEKMIARSFLGQAGIDNVYSMDCIVDSGSIQLFVADDADGGKYARWAGQAAIDAEALKSIKDLPFDPGKMFIADDPYYGKILIGIKGGKLIGAIGYHDGLKGFMSDWLNSILR